MKGQGLSITTIVVAAVALLVLVVLVAVFTGQFGGFSAAARECTAVNGARCADSAPTDGDWTRLFGKECPNDNEQCYVPVGSSIGTCAGNPTETGANIPDSCSGLGESECSRVAGCDWTAN